MPAPPYARRRPRGPAEQQKAFTQLRADVLNSNHHYYTSEDRASPAIFSLTSGARPCQAATSSDSASSVQT